MNLEFSVLGSRRLTNDFFSLVEPKWRRRILQSIGRKVQSFSRQRVRMNQNLDGTRFEPKKAGGKLKLKKLVKAKQIYQRTDHVSTTVFLKPLFASDHQFGLKKTERAVTDPYEIEKEQAKKKYRRRKSRFNSHDELLGNANYSYLSGPCSRTQAKYLKENWADIWKTIKLDNTKSITNNKSPEERKLGKGKLTIRKLQAVFTMGQAGKFIREYRLAKGWKPRSSWEVILPMRNLIGLTDSDAEELAGYIQTMIIKYSKFKILKAS